MTRKYGSIALAGPSGAPGARRRKPVAELRQLDSRGDLATARARLKCKHCGSQRTANLETRHTKKGTRRRRYVCLDCEHRFKTREIITDHEPTSPAQPACLGCRAYAAQLAEIRAALGLRDSVARPTGATS